MRVSTVGIARVLALVWAAFWLFFFIAEALAFNTPALGMAIWTGIGLLFLTLALLPWRDEKAGGVLLVAIGLLLAPLYLFIWGPQGLRLAVLIATALTFSVPPLVAGSLFLMHQHRTQRSPL